MQRVALTGPMEKRPLKGEDRHCFSPDAEAVWNEHRNHEVVNTRGGCFGGYYSNGGCLGQRSFKMPKVPRPLYSLQKKACVWSGLVNSISFFSMELDREKETAWEEVNRLERQAYKRTNVGVIINNNVDRVFGRVERRKKDAQKEHLKDVGDSLPPQWRFEIATTHRTIVASSYQMVRLTHTQLFLA
eukprot:GHVR01080473.1.p1 GENE.GHVR01080473.1~~GHVR01080473.1.p1  ORF type:complete len:187 (-),score=30.29 GHVR01080473.1:20-580(-)